MGNKVICTINREDIRKAQILMGKLTKAEINRGICGKSPLLFMVKLFEQVALELSNRRKDEGRN